jgi:uncharacterized membrane protein YphA (DoxX/SURF4 family)
MGADWPKDTGAGAFGPLPSGSELPSWKIMSNPTQAQVGPAQAARPHSHLIYRACLLLLCSAYLQGGLDKAFDFPAAIAEMQHFGLQPAAPLALLTIAGELGASLLVLTGIKRWLGAAWLALFTLAADFVANRFWELSGMARTMSENGFFEHLGLAGAFLLVAWLDLSAAPDR